MGELLDGTKKGIALLKKFSFNKPGTVAGNQSNRSQTSFSEDKRLAASGSLWCLLKQMRQIQVVNCTFLRFIIDLLNTCMPHTDTKQF